MEMTAKVTCPRCGRRSDAEVEAGDFPTRCAQCGALACQPGEKGAKRPLEQAPVAAPIKAGALAGILIARPPVVAVEKPKVKTIARSGLSISASGRAAADKADDVARVKARHNAILKAQLRGNYQVLGVVGVLLGMAALVMLAALALRGHVAHTQPAVTGVDVLHDASNR
jgi:endogenous inhibitor of DNA gyrase (YacG/DUF329 family)